jgi:phosphoribosylanthranilate isomerase
MKLDVKICGLSTPETLDAAVRGGARFVGFVFYPRSPRNVEPDRARALARAVPEGVTKVAVVVDPADNALAEIGPAVDMLQLHGEESPTRVAEIRARFGLPVMKVIKVAQAADLEMAAPYSDVADWLMFDAKPPPDRADALPGGNAVAFDWQILCAPSGGGDPARGRPWMLSGGLTLDNLAEAAAISGASVVDVSSGVEEKPGVKSVERIRAFLEAAGAARA